MLRAVLIGAAVCVAVFASAGAVAQEERPWNLPAEGAVGAGAFVVVDSGGKPVEGAVALIAGANDAVCATNWNNTVWQRGRVLRARMPGLITVGGLQDVRDVWLSVTAPGYEPSTVMLSSDKLLKGPVVLKRRREVPANAARGRVLDEDGRPLANACVVVTRQGINEYSSSMGVMEGDAFALTDAEGRFVLPITPKAKYTNVEVVCPGHAREEFTDVNPREEAYTLRLSRPAAVRGRVVGEGGPVAGLRLMLAVPSNTSGEMSTAPLSVTTGADGAFSFDLVPPGRTFVLASDVRGHAAIEQVRVEPMEPGASTDVGELKLRPTISVRGIVTAGQKQLPEGVMLAFLPCDVRVSHYATVDSQGAFEVTDLRPGSYRVVVARPEGWFLSARNGSCVSGGWSLAGKLSGSVENLRIEVQAGHDPSGSPRSGKRELRGVEPSPVAD